jgi:hypothetical protein
MPLESSLSRTLIPIASSLYQSALMSAPCLSAAVVAEAGQGRWQLPGSKAASRHGLLEISNNKCYAMICSMFSTRLLPGSVVATVLN